MKKIVVDITESDIDEFKNVVYRNRSFSWVFPTTDGEDVEIEFVPTQEEEEDEDENI